MNDFIHQQGPAFLAHILRRLADELVHAAADWYPTVGVSAPPRTISTLLALNERGPLGVTELAGLLKQSHTLVITWIKELSRLSLVVQKSDPADRRRTVISLTAKGRKELLQVREALEAMEQASTELMSLGGGDVWQTLWSMERACREHSFLERLHRAADSRK
ncbi:MarR family winged helix-turn-helix transcriptional regulator [Microbulbifer taiwanensis]|uniref:MarR family winged helix-turn-helix transcriptional regulator n=1 Tax=Microbulbifer taiwanensis TaxID=986746 RepID=A0ABW1YKV4_9GAMM|nr:MarR family winged helix-turn-helix transcriptional regulator [Microbulbifer taiwanensis]